MYCHHRFYLFHNSHGHHMTVLPIRFAKVWSVVAQAFYREQTMQFNAIYTRSGYSRPSDELRIQQESQEQQQKQSFPAQSQKKYLRCSSLSPAALWIIHSLQAHLQVTIMFRYVALIVHIMTMHHPSNAQTKLCSTLRRVRTSNSLYAQLHVLSPSFRPIRYDGGNVHSVQPVAQPQTRAYEITAQFVATVADCCHPYWHKHGLFWHFARGDQAEPAACKDVVTLERYHTSPSGA